LAGISRLPCMPFEQPSSSTVSLCLARIQLGAAMPAAADFMPISSYSPGIAAPDNRSAEFSESAPEVLRTVVTSG
jgi:hypothetical protein